MKALVATLSTFLLIHLSMPASAQEISIVLTSNSATFNDDGSTDADARYTGLEVSYPFGEALSAFASTASGTLTFRSGAKLDLSVNQIGAGYAFDLYRQSGLKVNGQLSFFGEFGEAVSGSYRGDLSGYGGALSISGKFQRSDSLTLIGGISFENSNGSNDISAGSLIDYGLSGTQLSFGAQISL